MGYCCQETVLVEHSLLNKGLIGFGSFMTSACVALWFGQSAA